MSTLTKHQVKIRNIILFMTIPFATIIYTWFISIVVAFVIDDSSLYYTLISHPLVYFVSLSLVITSFIMIVHDGDW